MHLQEAGEKMAESDDWKSLNQSMLRKETFHDIERL